MKVSLSYTNLSTRKAILLIIVVCICTFTFNSSLLPVDIMESRNLATAHEMVEYHNWLVPTLNGFPRFEKPPLPTWGAALVEKAFPHSIVAQRTLSALMATIWALFAFLLIKELTKKNKQALWVALVFATCYSVMFLARNATWDIWCHSLLCGGLYFYVRAASKEGRKWKDFLMAGLFFGLSFMSKGPISLYALLLPFLIAYHSIFRPNIKGKGVPMIVMILLTALLCAWWYVYLFLFAQNDMQRVIHQETGAWVNHSVRPWWYYWSFFKESGIWCLLWITSLFFTFRNKDLRQNKMLLLATVWTLLSIFCLSLFPEKKSRYLLPMMLPCACCVGTYLYTLFSRTRIPKSEYITYKINLGILTILLMGIAIFLAINPLNFYFPTIIVILLITWLVGTSIALIYALKQSQISSFGPKTIVIVMIGISILGINLIQYAGPHRNKQSLYLLQNVKNIASLPYYNPKDQELRPEILYSAGKRIEQIDCQDSATIVARMPFILLLNRNSDFKKYIPYSKYKILGTFNENWTTPGKSGYKECLEKIAVLVTK